MAGWAVESIDNVGEYGEWFYYRWDGLQYRYREGTPQRINENFGNHFAYFHRPKTGKNGIAYKTALGQPHCESNKAKSKTTVAILVVVGILVGIGLTAIVYKLVLRRKPASSAAVELM